ncbi:plasmid pRiA4b ORF-3 family protein [Bradyrhizobium pachyrhizi]|uniref:plasmid pRiA4b ORF-3 family protein n=1 Tax=Bradyrhizobium pachyrhizi TaxID=280333 RepID=UPI001FCD1D91|nr:plasmid pRiA4b ORF-3 family protein [Bradyrhizobium pachyrhizi]
MAGLRRDWTNCFPGRRPTRCTRTIRGWQHEPEHDRRPDQGDPQGRETGGDASPCRPVTLRLDRLHLTLQAAFGWTDSHLFEFLAGEGHWGIPDPDGDFGPQPIDARKARLCDIVRETGAKTIHYLYDFGDSWDHVIKLEKWFDNTSMDGLPFLLEAAGRCPPDDVGGAHGYADYLDAIGDPTHPEHEHMRLWGPPQFDPNVVNRKALEAAVNALSEKWKPRRHKLRSK